MRFSSLSYDGTQERLHKQISMDRPTLPTTRLKNLLTPCSRVLLDKLTGFQLVKKIPAFYGTRRFITAFTNVRYLPLSSASSIQSTSHFSQVVPFLQVHQQNPVYASPLTHSRYMPRLSHSSRFCHPNNIG